MEKPIIILDEEDQHVILKSLELMDKQISVGLNVSVAKNMIQHTRKKIYNFQARYQGWELYGKDK